jgi:hypothetical protein
MGFKWRDLIKVGIGVASVTLPGGKLKDDLLGNVVAIIDSETSDNADATKLTAAAVDALAKRLKTLEAKVEKMEKGG